MQDNRVTTGYIERFATAPVEKAYWVLLPERYVWDFFFVEPVVEPQVVIGRHSVRSVNLAKEVIAYAEAHKFDRGSGYNQLFSMRKKAEIIVSEATFA